MSSRALKMLGEGLAAEIELYECFWGNLGIYPPTQINGTLKYLGFELLTEQAIKHNKMTELEQPGSQLAIILDILEYGGERYSSSYL